MYQPKQSSNIEKIEENSFFEERNFHPLYEFHLRKKIRDEYDFEETIYAFNGRVIFSDLYSVRLFVHKLNERREDKDKFQAGHLNALSLLDEVYHYLTLKYNSEINQGAVARAIDNLQKKLGSDNVNKTLYDFVKEFPPYEVYKKKKSEGEYLSSFYEARSIKEITYEEILTNYILNINPAAKKYKILFDDEELKKSAAYLALIDESENYFSSQKPFPQRNQTLLELFKEPIRNAPEDLEAQLHHIINNWKDLLPEELLNKLLIAADLIKEERLLAWGGGGGAPTVAPKFKGKYDDLDFLSLGKSGYKYARDAYLDLYEPENFTPDVEWMPNVILLAKNTFVWMEQLSKKYQRHIHRLDQIPDEELDQLARWGFTGLWLIGIWERSSASKKIKHIHGKIDAVASAYSLYDYVIAQDLGGEEAFENLKQRAFARGIRLASDMVPNHTGIYSKWVVEKPHYFIQTNRPPFPSYKFTGPDLSDDPRISIRIEDGYWSKTDAAVVFQRVDNQTGETRYIYHGNDGTNMPWNDTAQLNYLLPEVREAVIQMIFHVARKTSIIRFDAAMTLTKRHYQRLWFPQPGTGGDIPSRVDFAMTKEEFDKHMTNEFWREVVDRINQEMPNTLLLAEAFWLLEGYFVRSLGMHRVYNSAFMHMLMKEENEKYRDLITNTLEYNPEILKRYVNFMSNPDEETAIRQFGSDDKYFGVCLLMVTLPGLPMFAHGQIEGFHEKYGMEFKRPYYDETPNQYLIDRHEREIFPLMKKRYLFSQIENFWFYDFYDQWGKLNENVFAYSNYAYGERALIFYNNKYQHASGWIKRSTGKNVGGNIISIDLSEALRIKNDENVFYIFRDLPSSLIYIRSGAEIYKNGFYAELGAFKYHAFIDWVEKYDVNGDLKILRDRLNGRGCRSLKEELNEIKYGHIYAKLRNLISEESLDVFNSTCIYLTAKLEDTSLNLKKLIDHYIALALETQRTFNYANETLNCIREFDLQINVPRIYNFLFKLSEENDVVDFIVINLKKKIKYDADNDVAKNGLLYLFYSALKALGCLNHNLPSHKAAAELYENICFDQIFQQALTRLGRGDYEIYSDKILISLLLAYDKNPLGIEFKINDEKNIDEIKIYSSFWNKFLSDELASRYLRVNQYKGSVYYSKEMFEDFCEWQLALAIAKYLISVDAILPFEQNDEKILLVIKYGVKKLYEAFQKIIYYSNESEYKVDILQKFLSRDIIIQKK